MRGRIVGRRTKRGGIRVKSLSVYHFTSYHFRYSEELRLRARLSEAMWPPGNQLFHQIALLENYSSMEPKSKTLRYALISPVLAFQRMPKKKGGKTSF